MSKSIEEFSNNIADVIFDNSGKYDIELLFYLTRHCNLSCNGCYMNSGPNASRAMLPMKDLRYWLKEFEKVSGFDESVVFSGGEIFSLPIPYVEHNAHQVLDRGWRLQLKTNGAWVSETERRDAIRAMLRRLQPHQVSNASDDDVKRALGRLPKVVWRAMGNKLAGWLLWQMLKKQTALDLVVSVDNKLHPKQSAKWFEDIANMLVQDSRLSKTVNLKTFTFFESIAFFEDLVLDNKNLDVSNFRQMHSHNACEYTVHGKRVETYFGDFIKPSSVSIEKKLSEIAVPDMSGRGRLIYSFMPDRTVGVECDFVDSVGRVPYVADDGQMKSFQQIKTDIHKKLVEDYKKVVAK